MDPTSGWHDRVAALRHAVRRGVLGRRRLLSGLLAAGAVLAGLRAVAPPPPDLVEVAVAAVDLPAGARLDADDLATQRLPPGAVPDGLAPAPEGEVLAGPVRAGEVLTTARLVGPGLLADEDVAAGLVALPVRIPDAGSVALLRVGQRIDLIGADPAAATPQGRTLVAGVRVLALPGAPSGAGFGAAERGRLVLVAVTRREAEVVSGHAARGLLTVALSG